MNTPSHTALYGDVLTNEQQYRKETVHIVMVNNEQRKALLARATKHDPSARTAIIENCLPIVASIARKHILLTGTSVEYLDLVQIGNLALVENYEQALRKEDPFAFLIGCARFALYKYCRCHTTSITTPNTRGVQPYQIASLDVPFSQENDNTLLDILPEKALGTESSGPDYSEPLQQAVATLPEKEKLVVEHYYGLGELAPKALCDINRLLSPDRPQKGNAEYYRVRAMMKLRQTITLVFQQGEGEQGKAVLVHDRKRTHRSLPQEMWKSVALAIEQGGSTVKLAEQYGVSADTIRRVVRAVKQHEHCITSDIA